MPLPIWEFLKRGLGRDFLQEVPSQFLLCLYFWGFGRKAAGTKSRSLAS